MKPETGSKAKRQMMWSIGPGGSTRVISAAPRARRITMPYHLTGLRSWNINAEDFEAMVRFYRDGLGAEETTRHQVAGANVVRLKLGSTGFRDSSQKLMDLYVALWKGRCHQTSVALLRASARTDGRAGCSAARSRQCPQVSSYRTIRIGQTSAAIRSCRTRLRRRSPPSSPRRDGTPPPRRNRLASAPRDRRDTTRRTPT